MQEPGEGNTEGEGKNLRYDEEPKMILHESGDSFEELLHKGSFLENSGKCFIPVMGRSVQKNIALLMVVGNGKDFADFESFVYGKSRRAVNLATE